MSSEGDPFHGGRTNLYLAIIAYALVAGPLIEEIGDSLWYVVLPLLGLALFLPFLIVYEVYLLGS